MTDIDATAIEEPAFPALVVDGDEMIWAHYANGEWARLANDPRYDPWVRSWEGICTEYGVKRVMFSMAALKASRAREAALTAKVARVWDEGWCAGVGQTMQLEGGYSGLNPYRAALADDDHADDQAQPPTDEETT